MRRSLIAWANEHTLTGCRLIQFVWQRIVLWHFSIIIVVVVVVQLFRFQFIFGQLFGLLSFKKKNELLAFTGHMPRSFYDLPSICKLVYRSWRIRNRIEQHELQWNMQNKWDNCNHCEWAIGMHGTWPTQIVPFARGSSISSTKDTFVRAGPLRPTCNTCTWWCARMCSGSRRMSCDRLE